MNTITLAVSRLRKEQGVTQKELAEHLGVSCQSVSKWENGITLPDIQLLPEIAAFFKVSVDQLLGLKKLYNNAYTSRKSNTPSYWKEKHSYLESTRKEFWNQDYFDFLVKQVWNLNKPINIIDFGCGYGFLGAKLMEILPKGSTYTGIDVSQDLINHGKNLLKQYGSFVQFVHSNVLDYKPDTSYDLVICQAFLRHLPDAKLALNKMIESAKKGGLVACIEVNRPFEATGTLIEGMPYTPWENLNTYSKLWSSELDNEKRDFACGLRLPIIMTQLGLKDVDVRMNDKVTYISGQGENDLEQVIQVCMDKGWKKLSEKERSEVVGLLENRGYLPEEVRLFIESNDSVFNFIENRKSLPKMVSVTGTLISYGYRY